MGGNVHVMSGELDHLSMAIGGLQAEVKILTRTVRDNQEASSDEHRKVHDIVVASSEAIRNLTKVVEEMKPLTDDYREKRAEGRGRARMAYAMYATSGGIMGAIAAKVLEVFSFKPHP